MFVHILSIWDDILEIKKHEMCTQAKVTIAKIMRQLEIPHFHRNQFSGLNSIQAPVNFISIL